MKMSSTIYGALVPRTYVPYAPAYANFAKWDCFLKINNDVRICFGLAE